MCLMPAIACAAPDQPAPAGTTTAPSSTGSIAPDTGKPKKADAEKPAKTPSSATDKKSDKGKQDEPAMTDGEKKDPGKPSDPDDEAALENDEAESAAVARPVSGDPVQIYGWREYITIKGVEKKLKAKLDTGALTSSIHAEEKELFERDGKKWVRFIVTDPGMKKPSRSRIEAPLVRIAKIKEPGGESVPREVVRLSFQIGDKPLRGDFTLNNRSNMLAPVLLGRSVIKDLGWVDSSRTHIADEKIFR